MQKIGYLVSGIGVIAAIVGLKLFIMPTSTDDVYSSISLLILGVILYFIGTIPTRTKNLK